MYLTPITRLRSVKSGKYWLYIRFTAVVLLKPPKDPPGCLFRTCFHMHGSMYRVLNLNLGSINHFKLCGKILLTPLTAPQIPTGFLFSRNLTDPAVGKGPSESIRLEICKNVHVFDLVRWRITCDPSFTVHHQIIDLTCIQGWG